MIFQLLIETLVTNENGQAMSSGLYKGTYYLKEIDTGSVYYLLNGNTLLLQFTFIFCPEKLFKTLDMTRKR